MHALVHLYMIWNSEFIATYIVLSIGLEHFDHRLFSCHHWSVMLLPSDLKRKSVILNIIKNIIVKHGISSQISYWWRLLIPCYAPERWTISLIQPRELEMFFFVTSKVSFNFNRSYTYRWHNNFHSYFYRCIDSWPHSCLAKKKYLNLRTSWYITGVSPHSAGPGLRCK